MDDGKRTWSWGGGDVDLPRHERPASNLLLLVVFPNMSVKFLTGVVAHCRSSIGTLPFI